jgi:aminoglycoside phosphotransferase (APT) family kinase protein
MVDWIAGLGGGEITRLERHVARREAWVVDVTASDGSTMEGFLRLERGKQMEEHSRLERETRIVQALGSTDVPVVDVLGRNDELRATLFARDPGRSDIENLEDLDQQRAVMEDFVRVLARLHLLDLDTLNLDDVMDDRPETPEQCALAEVERAQRDWQFFLADYVDPLTTFGVGWLQRNVPQNVSRISLLQGDTGPVNFMFQGPAVSSVIDWEMGHFGDPMDDLGSLSLREFWNPSGGLTGLGVLYEKESGLPYDRHAVQFHRVRQNVRDMIPIHYLVNNPMPQESHAWYLCYRYLADRATVEAIADNMNLEISRPKMPDDGDGAGELAAPDLLVSEALSTLERDVAPEVTSDIARSRAVDLARLIRCLDRRSRYGAELAEAERREIGELLGTSPSTAGNALGQLDQAIRDRAVADEAVVPYLANKAYREEWLYAPAVEKYPGRSWSVLD